MGTTKILSLVVFFPLCDSGCLFVLQRSRCWWWWGCPFALISHSTCGLSSFQRTWLHKKKKNNHRVNEWEWRAGGKYRHFCNEKILLRVLSFIKILHHLLALQQCLALSFVVNWLEIPWFNALVSILIIFFLFTFFSLELELMFSKQRKIEKKKGMCINLQHWHRPPYKVERQKKGERKKKGWEGGMKSSLVRCVARWQNHKRQRGTDHLC